MPTITLDGDALLIDVKGDLLRPCTASLLRMNDLADPTIPRGERQRTTVIRLRAEPRTQDDYEVAVAQRRFARANLQVLSNLLPLVNVASKTRGRLRMASVSKRRNGEGSASWDALARVGGFPTIDESFATSWRLSSGQRAPRPLSRAAPSAPRRMTFEKLLDEGLPRLRNPGRKRKK